VRVCEKEAQVVVELQKVEEGKLQMRDAFIHRHEELKAQNSASKWFDKIAVRLLQYYYQSCLRELLSCSIPYITLFEAFT
jgi:hypothetical protein